MAFAKYRAWFQSILMVQRAIYGEVSDDERAVRSYMYLTMCICINAPEPSLAPYAPHEEEPVVVRVLGGDVLHHLLRRLQHHHHAETVDTYSE
jgi:hypothetical protein